MSKKRVFSQEEVNDIVQLYNDGNTTISIAKKYKTKQPKISKLLRENGCEIRNHSFYKTSEDLATQKTYSFNDKYFEKIDSSDKAYWLGFMFADGSVNPRYNENRSRKGINIELSLKNEDAYHVENFVRAINGNMPLKYRMVKFNGKTYEAVRLSFGSVRMGENLINNGCIPKKSLTLQKPINLPNHLTSHFLRGYFDGDGCVTFYEDKKSKNFGMSILGTEEFLIWYQEKLADNNIQSNLRLPNGRKVYELKITNIENLRKFYDFIYKDKCYFLARKYEKFIKALKYYNQTFQRNGVACMADLLD